jgi:hypothetical protein
LYLYIVCHLSFEENIMHFFWQLQDSGSSPSSAIELDVLWLSARKNKDGVIDNDRVQEAADRVVST